MFVGVTLGLIMSNELTMPDLFAGIPQLVFSRLRPAHVNMNLFGFLGTTFYGGWNFIVPRLCRTPLRTNREANILLFLWNLTILAGSISLTEGGNMGHEYGEYPMYINYPVEALLIWNACIIFRTIFAREVAKIYVSLWYIGGTVIWISVLYFIGHVMWHPFTTYLPDGQMIHAGATIGLDDAVWNWFYGHNVFGLYITTGGIALVYYLVPKIAKRPLYSHTLSLVGFWTIALLYTPTGQHHLLQAPIPNWLKVYAIIGSIALIVPVFAFVTNIFMTMRGEWAQAIEKIPLRFILTGVFFYLAVSFQGSIQSLMSVNRFIHYTQWVVAHAHLALLGAFGFISSGTMLYMVPQILRRPLWSRNLADAQYWLFLIGLTGFFWSLTAAGLAQGSAWLTLGQQVVRAYTVVKPYFLLRTAFAALIYLGVIFQVINLAMTVCVTNIDREADRRKKAALALDEPLQTATGASLP
jgi:cbb3-type cytochrome c oxidase subunit I